MHFSEHFIIGVHTQRGIMGNQGKFTKKQSRKANVYLYISILISHFETNHIVETEKPLFQVYQCFWADRAIVVGILVGISFFHD